MFLIGGVFRVESEKKTIDRTIGPLKLDADRTRLLNSIRIVGDTCTPCKYKRSRHMVELRHNRASINEGFGIREGLQIGMAVGLLWILPKKPTD